MKAHRDDQDARRHVTFAANNGEIGGGEIMLLQMARAAISAGWGVSVVGPNAPNGVLDKAEEEGARTIRLASGRRDYIWQLRRWDRQRSGLLWCNGLVPAFATAGRARRVVHLHRLPEGIQVPAAHVARLHADRTIVPSHFMADRLKGASALPNWSQEVRPFSGLGRAAGESVFSDARVGFLGRLSPDKGVHTLAQAISMLSARGTRVKLVVAGEYRFVDKSSERFVKESLDSLGTEVMHLGWTTPETLFSMIDVLVVPSIWEEPFGLVVTEAMSANIPVIVSDAGALPEVVGSTYPWIFPAGRQEMLAEMLDRFLGLPATARAQVARAARGRWQENFSPEAGEKAFLDHLNSLN